MGENVSGDVALVEERDEALFAAIIDGLGHGPEAHSVANRAEAFLRRSWTHDPAATMLRLHEELKGTRGAAAGLALLERASGLIRYVGVGNTVIRRVGAREARLHSRDGVVGHSMRTPTEQTMHLESPDVLLMYTDGLPGSLALEAYPQLLYQGAETIARTVVRRYGKTFDDATCLVIRHAR
jgi:serine/threonine protein phosphatase PrpC